MFAVIKTGGKQYRVAAQDVLEVDKIEAQAGETIKFEEVLLIGASLDAANELTRKVAEAKGAAFGWHRVTLPQLAVALAAPLLAERKLVPISRLGAEAIVAGPYTV